MCLKSSDNKTTPSSDVVVSDIEEDKEVEGMKFHDIEGGFGEGKKAMLVKEIANIHGRDTGKVNELINKNIIRFKNGIDILDLKGSNFDILLKDNGIYTQNALNRSENIYLLSERGYAKLLKILEDDVAWEQYEYFNKNVDWVGVRHYPESRWKRSSLKKFEKYEFLTQEATKTGRLINIVNWELYQGLQEETNKEVTKDLTKNQQIGNKELTTNKNDKNDKNDKEVYIGRKIVTRFLDVLERDEMITTDRTTLGTKRGTTIKVSNYNDYQGFSNGVRDNQGDINNNEKKEYIIHKLEGKCIEDKRYYMV